MRFESSGVLSAAFKKDLKVILATSPEEVQTIVNAYLKHLENLKNIERPFGTVNVDVIEDDLSRESKIQHQTFVAISRLILYSSQIFTAKEMDEFEKKLSKVSIESNERIDFLKKFALIKESGLTKIFYYNKELEKIVSFGIKRFSSINFMTDYRIFDTNNENRILAPVIIARLTLRDEEDFDDNIIFQMSSNDFDQFGRSVAEFKSKFDKEREIINDMTYKG